MRPIFSWTKDRERRPDGDAVRILLISRDGEYRDYWRRVFEDLGWGLEHAASLAEGVEVLRAGRTPVVVYDWQAAMEEDWRDALNTVAGLPQRPCVLVASSVMDEGFRDEVVRLHGYDVLRRQANEEEITRTINSAWFWKHRNA